MHACVVWSCDPHVLHSFWLVHACVACVNWKHRVHCCISGGGVGVPVLCIL